MKNVTITADCDLLDPYLRSYPFCFLVLFVSMCIHDLRTCNLHVPFYLEQCRKTKGWIIKLQRINRCHGQIILKRIFVWYQNVCMLLDHVCKCKFHKLHQRDVIGLFSVVVIFNTSNIDHISCYAIPLRTIRVIGRHREGIKRHIVCVRKQERNATEVYGRIWSHNPFCGPMRGKIPTPSYLAENWAINVTVSAVKYVGTFVDLLPHPARHTQVSSEAFVLWKGMKNKYIRFHICAQREGAHTFSKLEIPNSYYYRQSLFSICRPNK